MIEVVTMGLECREETSMDDHKTDTADRMGTINHAGLRRCLHHRGRPDSALESRRHLLRQITTTTGPTTTTVVVVIQATISLEVLHPSKHLPGIKDMVVRVARVARVDMVDMVASLMAEVGVPEVIGMDGLIGSWGIQKHRRKQAKGESQGILIKFVWISRQ